ncbi:hypothetical protein [Streptococcus suis]|uniref:hypothetical protein n=1 Tax=Streptococcus suis TaxID=1307 RepID=UPI0024101904|nr:hypothetical protein [Streptococcus suis]MDG3136904.1 hypothetical protein [Streptococcus suis]
MKKIVNVVVAVFSVFVLIGCSTLMVDKLDGEYTHVIGKDRTGIEMLAEDDLSWIDGTTADFWHISSDELIVDVEKKVLIAGTTEFPYVYEDGLLKVDGETYYKIGSKAYKEKLKEIEQSRIKD